MQYIQLFLSRGLRSAVFYKLKWRLEVWIEDDEVCFKKELLFFEMQGGGGFSTYRSGLFFKSLLNRRYLLNPY